MSEQKTAKVVQPDNVDDEHKVPGKIIGLAESAKNSLSSKSPKAQRIKKVFVPLVIIVVIVAGLVGWHIYQSAQNSKNAKNQAFQTMIKLEETAWSRNQSDIAKNLLLDFIAKYPNNNDNLQLQRIYNALSAIYQTAGDYKTAQAWQIKAFNISPHLNFTDYYNLAEVCRRAGDKKCAISNYQLALDRLNHGDSPPGIDGWKVYVKAQLKALSK